MEIKLLYIQQIQAIAGVEAALITEVVKSIYGR